ncbi:MAG: acyltransferase [Proteobacteria bacterium]|nr:acyltransferase [Pseudomonadota bacterium]
MNLHNKSSAFRPEIEGLRAIAAILVAVFHIWLGRVSGGVDVFFVVSSFLITTGLLGHIDRWQRVDFALFWGRLLKRLVPVAYLVLVAVIVAAVFMMPKSRWKDTIEQVAAATVYLENWALAFRAVDYLAQHEAVSPVQHYWALSVQGQFYIVWPMLVAAAAVIARRAGIAFRTLLTCAMALIFGLSLAFSVYLTAHNQPFAYFNTFTRAWEFSMGGLLAIAIPYLRPARPLRVILGWAGVLAIVSCGIVLQVSRVFPGYAALWPSLAAVCIITAGTSGSRFGADRLLAARPMVYLGGISYGIYLWHFPILAFWRQYAQPYELPGYAGVVILVMSIGLAALSTHYIEGRIREPRGQSAARGRPFVFALACVAPIVVGLGMWSAWYLAVKHPHTPSAAARQDDHPGALARAAGFQYVGAPNVDIVPGPLQVAEDREILDQPGCVTEPDATQPGVCRIAGSAGGGKRLTIAVVGGSHSAQWLPALKMIADPSGWDVYSFTKSNCPFSLGEKVSAKEVDACPAWNRNVLQKILALRPDAVFMTSTRYNGDESNEYVPDGYLNVWQQLAAANIKVIALRDNPDFEFDVSACVELHGADSPLCALPRQRMLEVPSPTELLRNPPSTVRFIDLSDYFCSSETCPPVIGNVLVYRHMNHITATYVKTLAPMLQSALEQALQSDAGT